jgi:hypothetical protein
MRTGAGNTEDTSYWLSGCCAVQECYLRPLQVDSLCCARHTDQLCIATGVLGGPTGIKQRAIVGP